jgi:hypothetical protein
LNEAPKSDLDKCKELIEISAEMKKEINVLKGKLDNYIEKNIELNNKVISLEQENVDMKQKLDKIESCVPFLDELEDLANENCLCDFPFQNDKLNHSTSIRWDPYFSFGKDQSTLTKIKDRCCINTNGLLAVKRNINLNRDWMLQFEFCKKDWSPADWSHIFSFGTHYNYGGDYSYYAITLETEPRDGYKIMKLTSSNAGDGNWHTITVKYTKQQKLLEGLLDNKVLESKKVSLGSTSGFYFGGQGGCKEFSLYLRNFKFVLDTNIIKKCLLKKQDIQQK